MGEVHHAEQLRVRPAANKEESTLDRPISTALIFIGTASMIAYMGVAFGDSMSVILPG